MRVFFGLGFLLRLILDDTCCWLCLCIGCGFVVLLFRFGGCLFNSVVVDISLCVSLVRLWLQISVVCWFAEAGLGVGSDVDLGGWCYVLV